MGNGLKLNVWQIYSIIYFLIFYICSFRSKKKMDAYWAVALMFMNLIISLLYIYIM